MPQIFDTTSVFEAFIIKGFPDLTSHCVDVGASYCVDILCIPVDPAPIIIEPGERDGFINWVKGFFRDDNLRPRGEIVMCFYNRRVDIEKSYWDEYGEKLVKLCEEYEKLTGYRIIIKKVIDITP